MSQLHSVMHPSRSRLWEHLKRCAIVSALLTESESEIESAYLKAFHGLSAIGAGRRLRR